MDLGCFICIFVGETFFMYTKVTIIKISRLWGLSWSLPKYQRFHTLPQSSCSAWGGDGARMVEEVMNQLRYMLAIDGIEVAVA